MTHQKLNRIVAFGVFLLTLAVYIATLSPTVVFWDVGEFIAAAKYLQVPHPPGSPVFLLVARLAMMIPFVADQAVRAHAVSAVLSAFGIFFLYLVIVQVILDFRGVPETLLEKIGMYGASAIGAFSLAFSTTYWDNSIEAEVYGASMFFLALILWLAMRWREQANEEGNEKYVVFIAYLIGLSLGVHLLSLLAIFPVLMFIYFKRYEFTLNSFVKFGLIATGVFFVVYPGIVKWWPGMMDGEWAGKKSEIIAYIPWIVMAGACYGVYTSYRKKQKILHIALLSMVLIFIGYTTYTSVLIRSNANPPMNENDPSNLARLTSYLGREQYGNAPLFMPRRYSQEPHQQEIYTKYSSDWDFMVRYQLNHMFFRYVGWNFIGAESDIQDAGVSWKDTLGIPFLVGLFGLYSIFKKDWKMGLVFAFMFVVMGPILALYQNQQEPQPRERDYFYVGAYYVFSVWIAVGLIGILDLVKQYLKEPKAVLGISMALMAGFAIGIPGTLLRANWFEHDRSGNYVAWDYSYNILQTCEKDAILFTNGDNDTFPLWYLQDVEGIRRDVRIVNLSLVNTSWYIQQMKNKPYYAEALPVPISLSDARIANIQPVVWEPRVIDLPVTKEAIERYGATDTAVVNRGKISWMMRNTMQFGSTKAIRIQDIMVRDILFTNQWKRPIFFAVTCSPDSKIGLEEYLWFHGLAWRLEPRKINREDMGLNTEVLEKNLMEEPEGFSKGPQYGYKFRNLANPKVYFDENTSRLMLNYRSAFVRLAMAYANSPNGTQRASAALDRMEALIPRAKVPLGWELGLDLSTFYHRIGREDRFNELSAEVEETCQKLIASGQANPNSPYNPYRALFEIYDIRRDNVKKLDLLRGLSSIYPNDPQLKQQIDMLQQQVAAEQARPADSAARSAVPAVP
jgi:hypothetical protein